MNQAARTKKLTLHKEALRRLTHKLTDQQLARVLGGNDVDCGAPDVPIRTHEPSDNEACNY